MLTHNGHAQANDAYSPQQPSPRPNLTLGKGVVERSELDPVMAADGSGLPLEIWNGLDVDRLEKITTGLPLPPRSPAMARLLVRLFKSQSGGDRGDPRYAALRFDMLDRLGATPEEGGPSRDDAAARTFAIRAALLAGETSRACELATKAGKITGDVPKSWKGETLIVTGLCAALAKDAAGAGLAAELAREEGVSEGASLAALDALSTGAKPKLPRGTQLAVLDYAVFRAAGGTLGSDIFKAANPQLLVAVAMDKNNEADLRLEAAERAARANALAPERLAELYRSLANAESGDGLLSSASKTPAGTPVRRAGLFAAAEREATPARAARLISVLVSEARRAGLLFATAPSLRPLVLRLRPEPEIGWFAETAAEVLITAGAYGDVRRWTAIASSGQPRGGLDHWAALADLADPDVSGDRAGSLAVLEDMALRGRFAPDRLHRLATVLDALNANVPIALWEAASRTPQPESGHLPATGVLSALQDAAKQKQTGRTALLVLEALGPDGAEGAHMIALGDAIRGLRRAGLEAEARGLALEALLPAWPRTSTN